MIGGSATTVKGEDSPKGMFRLRVSSGLKDAFAWAVTVAVQL
jgi:hypothetical protein